MDEFRNAQVNKMKNQWYHGSASGVLAALVETDDISPEDLQKMKELLDGYNS